jgi:MFS transporter, DHA2 family, multidrug resistance protein
MAVRDHVPLGGIALVLIMGALPRTPVAHHRFDWLSALLSAVTFGMLITGIDNLRRLSIFVALELAAATVAGALFVWRQLLLPYPMLAVELFARPVFALSVATSVCSFTTQNLAFVSLPFFFLITDYPQPSKLSTNHEHSIVSAGLNDGTEQSPVSKRPQ